MSLRLAIKEAKIPHVDMGEARKGYRQFAEKVMGEEMESPLENVFASTFLGNEKFVDWAKEKWIGFKNADERNIPVLKQIKGRPLIEDIEKRITLLMGYSLKEIGAYYGMRGSAVSQSNGRVKEKIDRNRRLKRILRGILKDMELLIVET